MNELPALITDSTRMAIARRIMITSFRGSSAPLITMLLMLMTLQLHCALMAHLYRLTIIL